MAVMGYKAACIFALNTGAIDRYEFDSLRGARFNLESRSPKLSRMAKKVVALYQLRPVKGIAILMPEREINRLMKEYHGLEGSFDIVYSRSMIKGGIEVDSLSKLASSKPVVNKGEEGARINQMFLESLSFFTNSASAVDEISRLVKGEIDDIKNNTNNMYNSTNLNSARFTLSRRASLFRTAGILGDARLLLQEGRESIDNLVKKGLSVHLPGTQYQYIMDDPYALLFKCNEWATKTTIEEVDKTEDGESVYKVTGNVVTKRGGKVTLLRNPHNYFSAFVTRDSLSAEEAFTGDKAWMKLLFEQNIVMLPADEIVFYMDGADFDGDKAMVIYGEEYPSLTVSEDNLIIDFREFFLPFYVEDGIGNYASRKMIMDVNIRTVSTSVLESFGSVSQIGKISIEYLH